ncbi:DNA methyltransferase [Stenotrophomonas sp. HITSZ_GD]|uniref:DNA-methyltransferase n=1 Tax=Stenotrophomonas sp. HITSZ_GD TaxID=3037248 RepID=UPI00240E438A|nr:DNA methyltransferase [Stenotrophomonas sp. HITSZ_GD]MDG2524607.1 DNA methyltransferase [Stenotrophomonas sp. HITSZ_GD]
MIHIGDCLEVMRGMAENSVDAVVTDPPYGIGFMGKAWDGADIAARHGKRRSMPSADPTATANGAHNSAAAAAGAYDLSPEAMRAFQRFSAAWAAEALRVLKPGGYLLSFAAARTYHRMASGIEDAGFDVRDQIMWVFGSGFPKSHNGPWGGTALKPAHEPIVMARKPLIGTVESNWRAHGTGALNIDGCRVVTGGEVNPSIARRQGAVGHLSTRSAAEAQADGKLESRQTEAAYRAERAGEALGRWPANLIHDGSAEVLAEFPDAPGQLADASRNRDQRKTQNTYGAMRRGRGDEASADSENEGAVGFKMRPGARRFDAGGAARFFYCAKASKADRDEGLEAMAKRPAGMVSNTSGQHMTRRDDGYEVAARANYHPTVKPTDLMRYLCRLVTPAGGIVLDPFAGSGSTGKAAVLEGFQFIGIELDSAYAAIAEARIRAAQPGLPLGVVA